MCTSLKEITLLTIIDMRFMVSVAKRSKAPGCGPGDRGFKSLHSPHRPCAYSSVDRASVLGFAVTFPKASFYVQKRVIESTAKTLFCA